VNCWTHKYQQSEQSLWNGDGQQFH
jgi:hypothetical protein